DLRVVESAARGCARGGHGTSGHAGGQSENCDGKGTDSRDSDGLPRVHDVFLQDRTGLRAISPRRAPAETTVLVRSSRWERAPTTVRLPDWRSASPRVPLAWARGHAPRPRTRAPRLAGRLR